MDVPQPRLEPCLVLQARMGSTRFPGKMLADIAGRTLLERVMRRLEAAWDGPKLLATSDADRDAPIAEFARARGWLVFRGSELDVLGRFAAAVRHHGIARVIRVCGDNPLIDPACVRGVAEALRDHDIVSARGWPLGTAVEGASDRAILAADAEAVEAYDREHVMPWLYRNAARFRAITIEASRTLPASRTPSASRTAPAPQPRQTPSSAPDRLTADTAEDIALFRRIFSALGDDPDLGDVIRFLSPAS
jgi:spore coat polysaccharide biosynthesis protein SpsF (cytidylyltransferase family)